MSWFDIQQTMKCLFADGATIFVMDLTVVVVAAPNMDGTGICERNGRMIDHA